MLCIGHRGACGYAPENTLASFRRALELGCPWVELDVHLVDGELVVIHDKTVDRTTDGEGLVVDHSLSSLGLLDAGNGEHIPTLREVADLIDRRAGINIELKARGTGLATGDLLDELCRSGWQTEQFLVSCFYHAELALVPDRWRRGALFEQNNEQCVERALALNAFSLNLSINYMDQAMVNDAQAAGLKVYVYTVNEPEDIERMKSMGVDGVFSDYPDRVIGSVT